MSTVSWNAVAADKAERDAERATGRTTEPLKPDWYDASVEFTGRRSKAGAPQVMAQFEIEGQRIPSWYTFTTAGYTYAMQDLIRLGLDVEDPNLPEPTLDPDNDWMEIDADYLADKLNDLAEVAGNGFRVRIATEDSGPREGQNSVKFAEISRRTLPSTAEKAKGKIEF